VILENVKAAPGKFVDLITTLFNVLSDFDATELTTPWKFILSKSEKETGFPISDCNKAERSFIRQLILLGKF
jgi:hypothetical protein